MGHKKKNLLPWYHMLQSLGSQHIHPTADKQDSAGSVIFASYEHWELDACVGLLFLFLIEHKFAHKCIWEINEKSFFFFIF